MTVALLSTCVVEGWFRGAGSCRRGRLLEPRGTFGPGRLLGVRWILEQGRCGGDEGLPGEGRGRLGPPVRLADVLRAPRAVSTAAATAGAGPATYLALVLLVIGSSALLLLTLQVLRRSPGRPADPPPMTSRPTETVRTLVLVVPVAPQGVPSAPPRRRAPRLVEDDVIAFGLALEASDDPVADALAESDPDVPRREP